MAIRLNEIAEEARMCLAEDGVEINCADLDKVIIELCMGCIVRRKYTVVVFPTSDMLYNVFKRCERALGAIFIPLSQKRSTFAFGNNVLEFASLDNLHHGSFRGTKLNAIIYYKV